MNRPEINLGTVLRITLDAPARFVNRVRRTPTGNAVECHAWAESFKGTIMGKLVGWNSTNRESYPTEGTTRTNTTWEDEFQYWNNPEINPEIEKFWDWMIVVDFRGIKHSVPWQFATSIEMIQPPLSILSTP